MVPQASTDNRVQAAAAQGRAAGASRRKAVQELLIGRAQLDRLEQRSVATPQRAKVWDETCRWGLVGEFRANVMEQV